MDRERSRDFAISSQAPKLNQWTKGRFLPLNRKDNEMETTGTMIKFTTGDKVEWISKGGGIGREKKGIIDEVVPVGQPPRETFDFKDMFNGGPRDHESYTVLVESGTTAKPKRYWPKAAQLRLAPATEQVGV